MQPTQPQKPVSTTSEQPSQVDSIDLVSNAFDVCFHFINKQNQYVQSQFTNTEDSLTLNDCLVILQDKMKKAMNKVVFKTNLEADPIDGETKIQDVVKGPDSEIYVYYQGVKAVKKQLEKQLHYEPIHKYSFLDEKKFVKVYLPLEGIGKLPAENITSRFLDKSIEVKIHDFNGKNWIFAIPKTQCKLMVKPSKVMQKQDKLIVCIAKIGEADNWFSLHKTKSVGETNED